MPGKDWFVSRSTGRGALRLFCFAFAGGGASTFLPWQAILWPEVEVIAAQLAGRGARLTEQPLESLPEVVSNLAAHIDFADPRPFAFFGHSLGALVAFELARYCHLRHLPGPRALIASGCTPPRCLRSVRPLHLFSQDKMLEALQDYGGTPPELLSNRELMLLVSPALRADFAMAYNYVYRPGLSLPYPIVTFGGESDPEVDPEQIGEWGLECSGGCRTHVLPGGHFFLITDAQTFLPVLKAELSRLID